VDQQFCAGAICPETPQRPPGFCWLNHWYFQPYIRNSSLSLTNLSLNFVYMTGITSDLAKKSGRGLRGVSGQFPPGQHCWSTRYLTKNGDITVYLNKRQFIRKKIGIAGPHGNIFFYFDLSSIENI
jgi:hypothetical protein